MRHRLASLLRRLAERIEPFTFPTDDKGEIVEPIFSRGMGVTNEWWQAYLDRVEDNRSRRAREILERVRRSKTDDPGSENFTP